MRFMAGAAIVLWLVLGRMGQAEVVSGPAAGTDVKPLKVDVVTGDSAGKSLDLAAERGDQPTVFVFVHGERFGRPAGRFLKKLDDAVRDHRGKAAIVVVWLTDDAAAAKTRFPVIQQSLQFDSTTLAVHASLKEFPEGWGLNADADVTAVVVAGKKVAANFAYVSVNETVVREVSEALAKSVK